MTTWTPLADLDATLTTTSTHRPTIRDEPVGAGTPSPAAAGRTADPYQAPARRSAPRRPRHRRHRAARGTSQLNAEELFRLTAPADPTCEADSPTRRHKVRTDDRARGKPDHYGGRVGSPHVPPLSGCFPSPAFPGSGSPSFSKPLQRPAGGSPIPSTWSVAPVGARSAPNTRQAPCGGAARGWRARATRPSRYQRPVR